MSGLYHIHLFWPDFYHCGKMPKENNLRRKVRFWLMTSEVTIWPLGPTAFRVARKKLPEAELKAEAALAVVVMKVLGEGVNADVMGEFG